MAELIVCSLMWALVLVLVIFRRARKERSVLYAAITIAVTMMLNDDDLYFIVDDWFGHRDIVHLISAITLMVGVHFLAQGISRAGVQRWMSGWPARIALWVAIVITIVAFFLIPHAGETTESFMREYGQYPAATVYSSTQYVYLTYVFSALFATGIHAIRTRSLTREKIAGALLVLGSVCTIALSVVVIGMNISQLMFGLAGSQPWRPVYYALQVGTFAFLTFGLGIAPIARWITEHRRTQAIENSFAQVTPLWEQAVAKRPSPKLGRKVNSPEERLHRRIVEVRDAAMDAHNDFTLTDADKKLLADAERQLVAGSR